MDFKMENMKSYPKMYISFLTVCAISLNTLGFNIDPYIIAEIVGTLLLLLTTVTNRVLDISENYMKKVNESD